ncbi:MAG: class I SAM-dependent methyltransferase [Nanoarchaeota archaeon]|nr:class I SAM-dependent methyltransferase [Nanoarchaeota archaeon]
MNYYNAIAKGYNELYGEEQLEKFEIIKNELVGRVLDIGCGTGIITKKIENAVGIDNSWKMLKQFDGERILGDAHNLPFKNKTFDTALSLTVLQDLKNPSKALKEMKRIARKVVFSIQKRNWTEQKIKKMLKKSDLKGSLFEGKKDWFFIQK